VTRPLVLLDVDGVINDLGHLHGHERPWTVRKFRAGNFTVHIPDFMPFLIQSLDAVAEIHWCTTWLETANTAIAPLLNVGPFPVVGADTPDPWMDWKPAAAHGLASAALADERRVFWIEDFYGEIPTEQMPPGVEYVDTGAAPSGAVLLPEMLPPELAVRLD
jgi:hypothetical protein